MEKILIFPFNYENYYFATHKHLLQDFELKSFICVKNSPFLGKDAGFIVDKQTNIIISDDYDKEIKVCDIVLLLDGLENDFLNLYIDKIKTAKRFNKKIIVTRSIYNKLLDNGSLHDDIEVMGNEDIVKEDIRDEGVNLFDIDIPVVSVMSLGDRCNKFDLQLDIGQVFKNNKFNALQIGTKEFCQLFGLYQLPLFLYSHDISLVDKIVKLNHFIYRLLEKENYDVIIVGASGGIMPYNKYVYNYFSEIPYIISQALKIDINILSLYFNKDLNKEFLQELRVYCKNKFNCITDYFNISNIKLKYDYELNHEQFFYLTKPYVLDNFPNIAEDNLYTFNQVYNVNSSILNSIVSELYTNLDAV